MKRFFSGLLVCVFLLGLLPTVAWAADDVFYLDRHWDEITKQVITEEKYASNPTAVTNRDTTWGTEGTTTWYVASGNVTIGQNNPSNIQRVTVTGDVRLILTDGSTLTVYGGIHVADDDNNIMNGSANGLTIYAQSTDERTMGKLTATATGTFGAAGIGGYCGAGGKITITGGTVETTGFGGGAGIGGGYCGAGGEITITGGTVEANSTSGAGIGGGAGGNGGIIEISGGTVTATSEGSGAGIGGGYDGAGGTITISDGTVTATGTIGAGIGGGSGNYGSNGGNGGTITISGGTVTAASGAGAGIGGGAGNGGSIGGAGGKITISGGEVTVASDSGADIGGGADNQGGIVPSELIEIKNATVKRADGSNLNIGPTEHEAKTDTWTSDGASHWHPCKKEGCTAHKFDIDAHTPGDWIVDRAAANSEAGQRHKECTVCGYVTATEAIPATGGGSGGGDGDGGDGGGEIYTPPTYKPEVSKPGEGGGTPSISPSKPEKGDTVTVTPKPDEGYEVDKITVTDRNGKSVEVTKKPDGAYTFTQPGGKVTIEVTYRPVERPWNNPFSDVFESDWYYEAVRFVQENGLMTGYEDGRFGPGDILSRAQLAQILFNKAGQPTGSGQADFTDVTTGAWYSAAVRWAADQGIVGGYGNGTFGPDDPITREQLAVMFWRYSGSPAAASKELHFSDESEISPFALEALRWAVENGIVNGCGDGRLGPQGQATRAQVAQMLRNFIENQEENIRKN